MNSKNFVFVSQKQNIRILYKRNKDDKILESSYIDCGMNELLTRKNKESVNYYYKHINDNIDCMGGRPQVTIGLSYALFTPLLLFYKDKKDYDVILSLSIYDNLMKIRDTRDIRDIEINNKLVCEGFVRLIIYYSTIASLYVKEEVSINYDDVDGYSYFKSAFLLKPRSNLAESYKQLKNEYFYFSEFIELP